MNDVNDISLSLCALYLSIYIYMNGVCSLSTFYISFVPPIFIFIVPIYSIWSEQFSQATDYSEPTCVEAEHTIYATYKQTSSSSACVYVCRPHRIEREFYLFNSASVKLYKLYDKQMN